MGNQYWILILLGIDAYFNSLPYDFSYIAVLAMSILIHDDKFKKIKIQGKEFWESLFKPLMLVLICAILNWYFIGKINVEILGSVFFLARVFLVEDFVCSINIFETFKLLEIKVKELQKELERLKR